MLKFKKLTLAFLLLPSVMTAAKAYRPIYPAEIMGRDLAAWYVAPFGHVALTTAAMNSPQGMNQESDVVIETLNEHPVIQINSHANFKARSAYWGNKYGVADRGARGYSVLLEANYQRWWCPKYTFDTKYEIGQGAPNTGYIIKCGTWRCDTFVWWAFYSQGWNVMPGPAWSPEVLWWHFPYFNNNEKRYLYSPKPENNHFDIEGKNLENVTSEELNKMSFEEFQMVMDAPPVNYVNHVGAQSSAQVRFAADPSLNSIKRGVMLDRLVSTSVEPDLVRKLLKLYEEEKDIQVKEKIVENLMRYNQKHYQEKEFISNDKPLLRNFFHELLQSDSLTNNLADDALRGFVDTHSADEVMMNKDLIDKVLLKVVPTSAVMLKYALILKSKELQPIYMQSIVDQLEKENDSDLDSYLFGPLAMAYGNSGKYLLLPETKKIVEDYLEKVSNKYSPKGLKADAKDFHRRTTAPFYFELKEKMK